MRPENRDVRRIEGWYDGLPFLHQWHIVQKHALRYSWQIIVHCCGTQCICVMRYKVHREVYQASSTVSAARSISQRYIMTKQSLSDKNYMEGEVSYGAGSLPHPAPRPPLQARRRASILHQTPASRHMPARPDLPRRRASREQNKSPATAD